MESKRIPRIAGVIIVFFVFLLLATLFSLVLYPTFSKSITTLVQKIPALGNTISQDLIPWVESNLGYKVPDTVSAAFETYRAQINEQIPVVIQRTTSTITNIWTQSQAVIASLLNMIMIPLFCFYFMRDFAKIRATVLDFVPQHNHSKIMGRLHQMDIVVGAWFRGQITVAAILAVLYSIGLAIIFSLNGIGFLSGIGVGIITGMLNIIPYFGVAIGLILSVLMVLIEWNGIWPVIGVGITFVIVQVLEGYYITPKVVGDAVGLSPVTVIIVLLIGGATFGLTGILIATPITGMIKVLLPDIVAFYKSSVFYTGKYLGKLDFSNPNPEEDPASRSGFHHAIPSKAAKMVDSHKDT